VSKPAHWHRAHGAAQGLVKGGLVGILSRVRVEVIAAMIGALRSGIVYVPLNIHAPTAWLNGVIRRAGIKTLLVDPGFPDKAQALDGVGAMTMLGESAESIPNRALAATPFKAVTQSEGALPEPHLIADDLAYVLYTSGSTRDPKGISITHRNASTFIDWMRQEYSIGEHDRVFNRAPLQFDLSVFDIFSTFAGGGLLVLTEPEFEATPAAIVSRMIQERITVVYTVPSAYIALLTKGGLARGIPTLRWLLYAGEPFPTAYLRQMTMMNGFMDTAQKPTGKRGHQSRERVLQTAKNALVVLEKAWVSLEETIKPGRDQDTKNRYEPCLTRLDGKIANCKATLQRLQAQESCLAETAQTLAAQRMQAAQSTGPVASSSSSARQQRPASGSRASDSRPDSPASYGSEHRVPAFDPTVPPPRQADGSMAGLRSASGNDPSLWSASENYAPSAPLARSGDFGVPAAPFDAAQNPFPYASPPASPGGDTLRSPSEDDRYDRLLRDLQAPTLSRGGTPPLFDGNLLSPADSPLFYAANPPSSRGFPGP